jgi:hypothetical protein
MENEEEYLPDTTLCPRCNCCEIIQEDCYNCGGEGGFDYDNDLQYEDPLWYQPGDFNTCDICKGYGSYPICAGGCDENGNHTHQHDG